jgi:dTDP-4-dehydrorhamnose reductase
LRILVNQCRATVLAMRAIKRIIPHARLIQTEDLGKTFATPDLKYQADHENERRWLSLDLLSGRFDRAHPWYGIFLANGIAESDLQFFLEDVAEPDIIGINHYLTSERYLDSELKDYPQAYWGENGRNRYADVAAARVPIRRDDLGPAARFREAWRRYGLPIAVTEVHNGSNPDEQLRWLVEVWDAAQTVQSEGVDIRAVTIWSIFGAFDWNTLLTRRDDVYESGLFDIQSDPPSPTLLAEAAMSLARFGNFAHPALTELGWWRRSDRYYSAIQPAA